MPASPTDDEAAERTRRYAEITEAIRNNRHALLARLDLDDAAIQDIAHAMRENTAITILEMNDNPALADQGTAAILAALENNRLERLQLTACEIGGEGGKAIANALKTQPGLKEIFLHRNHIGDEGAIAIAKAMHGHKALECLQVSGNNITDKGAIAIGKALAQCPALNSIYLTSNAIGDAGAKALAEGLAQSAIERLVINETCMTDKGAEYMAESLRRNHSLNRLSIGSSAITPVGMKSLALAARDHDGLVELSLADSEQPDAVKAGISQIILDGQPKNLVEVSLKTATVELRDYCRANKEIIYDLRSRLDSVNSPAEARIQDLCRLHDRMAAVKFTKIVNGMGMSAEKADELEAALPRLPKTITLNDLTEANDHGLTLLDSPYFWKNIEAVAGKLEKQGTPLSKDFLMQPNRDGTPSLFSAIYSDALAEILDTLAKRGEALTPDDLLTETGKSAPLLDLIVETKSLPALFSRENWVGQNPQALRSVYHALPSGAQAQIGNYHALSADVSRTAGQQGLQRY